MHVNIWSPGHLVDKEIHDPTDEIDVRFNPICYLISRSEYKCGDSCIEFHGGSGLIIWNDRSNRRRRT